MQPTLSDTNLTLDVAEMPEGWEPFVGDETTGLGESETVIETFTGAKESRKVFRGTKKSRLNKGEGQIHSRNLN
jgi:hypothetical protein